MNWTEIDGQHLLRLNGRVATVEEDAGQWGAWEVAGGVTPTLIGHYDTVQLALEACESRLSV